MKAYAVVLATVLALVAAACASDRVRQAESSAEVSVGEPIIAAELSGVHEFGGFGYQIGFPTDWEHAVFGSVSSLAEFREDLRDSVPTGPVAGISVGFDHRDREFMEDLGLARDADLDGFVDFNISLFEWDVAERTESELFERDAMSVRAVDSHGNHLLAIQGLTQTGIFVLVTHAPSSVQLDAFMPTWEAMVSSIRAI